MDVTQTNGRSDTERMRVAAVSVACAANLLSSILLNIQNSGLVQMESASLNVIEGPSH
jgi:hypothetical protein